VTANRFAKRAAFSAVLLLIVLLALEAATRLALHGITTTTHTSYFSLRWQRSIEAEHNHLGFREREFEPEPAAGVFRICVIGDSFTYGQGLPMGDRFTSLLQQRLDAAGGGKSEILNFGRDGAETEDHLAILREHVLPARPDFVLLQWFVNDVHEPSAVTPRPRRLMPWRSADRWLVRHSALWSAAQIAFSRLSAPAGPDAYVTFTCDKFADPNAGPSMRASQALGDFISACRQGGVPVGVVMFPDLTTELGAGYPFAFLMDRVAAQCSARDVTCLDLRPVLSRVPPSQARALWVNRFDSHPSRMVSDLAAEAILKTFGPTWR
jgi:hypothetical protein